MWLLLEAAFLSSANCISFSLPTVVSQSIQSAPYYRNPVICTTSQKKTCKSSKHCIQSLPHQGKNTFEVVADGLNNSTKKDWNRVRTICRNFLQNPNCWGQN
jgi:hypothetical protein